MTSLLLPLLTAYSGFARHRFIRQTQQPLEAQDRFLQTLLRVQQQTELGQQFRLAEIHTIEQFRDRVPIWSYSDYEPYVERVVQGERGVLNPDPVVYLSLTSGTTGKQKWVPVTRRFQQSLQKSNLVSIGFALEALRSRGRSFGKILTTNSARLQGVTDGGIGYGPVTVGSLRMGKLTFEQTFTLPYRVLEIGDSLSRHYVALLFALRNPQLRGLVSNFPMLVLRTCQYLEKYAEDLLRDLSTGSMASWLNLEPEMRQQLSQRWSAAPGRAAQLEHCLRQHGRLTPAVAWPELSFVVTARGGTSNFYFERFPEYFGDTPIFGGIYGSAEATFGICHDFNQDGCILALNSGFFEFVPQDQWLAEQPQTLLPTEVKVGEYYRILVTSYSGFYRYDIGDVVEVVGFYSKTPLIVFRHRRGGLLSSTTEKTTEFHATQAMQAVLQEFDLALDDFCLTLADQEFPAPYLVNIELSPGYELNQPQAFLARFEYWLQQVNNPYGTVRQDQVPPPRLRILAPGSFATVRQRYLAKGMPDSQLKIPHISEDRTLLAGLEVQQEINLSS